MAKSKINVEWMPDGRHCIMADEDTLPLAVVLFVQENGMVATEAWHPQNQQPLDIKSLAAMIATALATVSETNGVPIDDLADLAKEFVMNPRKHVSRRAYVEQEGDSADE